MIVRLEWWLAIGSLALVSYLVRSALFRDTPVPIGRVELTPGQQAWVGALIVIPIVIGTVIAVLRTRLIAYATDEHLALTFMYLTGFVVAVFTGIAPRSR